jgi:hypothetical protein
MLSLSFFVLGIAGCTGSFAPDQTRSEASVHHGPTTSYSGGLRDVALTRYNTCIDDLVYGEKYSQQSARFCFGSTGINYANWQPSGTGWSVVTLSQGAPSHRLKSDHKWTICDISGADSIIQCWGNYDQGTANFARTWAVPGAIDVQDVARYEPNSWTYFIDNSWDIQVADQNNNITSVPKYGKARQIDTYQDLVCATVGGNVQCGSGVVKSLSSVVDMSCGQMHCCAAMRDGTVGCWGIGELGDLGDGVVSGEETLTQARIVSGVSNAVQVAVGYDFSCALINDGSIRCWGSNEFGQLGAGLPQGSGSWYPPVEVYGIAAGNSYMIAAGPYHACSISSVDATLWCWGRNDAQQLGVNSGAGATQGTPILSFQEPQ